jgi:hypothetical protein
VGWGRRATRVSRMPKAAYLAFVDGDDVVASTAYELLVGSLEETGSDIACGNVARYRPPDAVLHP